MSKKTKTVLGKLIAQCTRAYQAQMPLIMVDTEEQELMERLARDGGLVDLVEKQENGRKSGNGLSEEDLVKYYSYVGGLKDGLDRSVNFSVSADCLNQLREEGSRLDSGMQEMLVLLHLTEDDETTPQTIAKLRAYVNSYVHCGVNGIDECALRKSAVLLYGDPGLLPKDLRPYTEILTVDYPQLRELQDTITRIVRDEKDEPLDEAVARELAEIMVGFSLIQVERYTRRLLRMDGVDGKDMIYCADERKEVLMDAKASAIHNTGGLLTLYREKKKKNPQSAEESTADPDREIDLGGMKAYKDWAKKAGVQMLNNTGYALDVGVPSLKGVLLCGVPGCGKSEAAKILHRQWGLPMLRLDVGALMGRYVGDSERNMRQALALTEAMSPCILWIDELEKGFSGAASGDGDGGVFKRMFGTLLTWMQENEKPCFIFATANDISCLPPEFFRSGRFDALFAVYMPTNAECKEIFAEQMRRAEERRADTAKIQGIRSERPALFEKECYEDTQLQTLMDQFTLGKKPSEPESVKFVSGADIQKITTTALTRIMLKKQKGENVLPINATLWTQTVGEVIRDPSTTTQGCGYANLDKIAACYVRLMRENFAPVSGEDQQLFQKSRYKCEVVDDQIKASYTGGCQQGDMYDRMLFEALKGRIEKLATRMEMNAMRRICE